MTKKWTSNILSHSFLDHAQANDPFANEKKLLAAAKPVAGVFQNLGFVESTFSDVAAFLRIRNGRINLHATQMPATGNDLGHFNGILIGLSLQLNDTDVQDHFLNIGVSLNISGEGQYALLAGPDKKMLSGDPRKIVAAFINETEGALNKNLMPFVNRIYGPQGLEQFRPFIK